MVKRETRNPREELGARASRDTQYRAWERVRQTLAPMPRLFVQRRGADKDVLVGTCCNSPALSTLKHVAGKKRDIERYFEIMPLEHSLFQSLLGSSLY